ncbi:MAG TPA: aldehyde dehydrogenase family protein [bacterium]|nr:aldehyde dehydrogenase family protein [bacterium]
MGKLASINPSNYKELGSVDFSTKAEVKKKVKSARKVAKEWKDIGVSSRVDMLRGFVKEVKKRKKELALIQAQEMGMPMNDALYDVDDSLGYVEWYLDNAHKYLTPSDNPMLVIISSINFAESRHSSECFITTVLPETNPWKAPQTKFANGIFHGIITPATPMGSLYTS